MLCQGLPARMTLFQARERGGGRYMFPGPFHSMIVSPGLITNKTEWTMILQPAQHTVPHKESCQCHTLGFRSRAERGESLTSGVNAGIEHTESSDANIGPETCGGQRENQRQITWVLLRALGILNCWNYSQQLPDMTRIKKIRCMNQEKDKKTSVS